MLNMLLKIPRGLQKHLIFVQRSLIHRKFAFYAGSIMDESTYAAHYPHRHGLLLRGS